MIMGCLFSHVMFMVLRCHPHRWAWVWVTCAASQLRGSFTHQKRHGSKAVSLLYKFHEVLAENITTPG